MTCHARYLFATDQANWVWPLGPQKSAVARDCRGQMHRWDDWCGQYQRKRTKSSQ